MNRDLCCAFEGFIEMLVSKINWEKIFFTAIFKKISFQKLYIRVCTYVYCEVNQENIFFRVSSNLKSVFLNPYAVPKIF